MLDIFLARLELAYAQDFSLLRRIPSTAVWNTLSYIQTLSNEERSQFFDTCAQIACQNAMASTGVTPPPATPVGSAAYESPQARLFEQIFSEVRFSAFPDRFMRQFAANRDALSQLVDESRIPAIMECEAPVVAKAGSIRRILHNRLKQVFQVETSNLGGGEWLNVGVVDDMLFHLHVDYGGMGPGIRYGIGFGPGGSGSALALAGTLESSFGFPTGVCDFPLSDELDQLADTTCNVIVDLSQLCKVTRGNNNAQQCGEPERRIGRILKSKSLGRRRVARTQG